MSVLPIQFECEVLSTESRNYTNKAGETKNQSDDYKKTPQVRL